MTDTPGKITTIRVSVNIATGNMWEGNSTLSMDIPTSHLKHVNPESFEKDIANLISAAIRDYNKRNELV